jgi:hypothetical protein
MFLCDTMNTTLYIEMRLCRSVYFISIQLYCIAPTLPRQYIFLLMKFQAEVERVYEFVTVETAEYLFTRIFAEAMYKRN